MNKKLMIIVLSILVIFFISGCQDTPVGKAYDDTDNGCPVCQKADPEGSDCIADNEKNGNFCPWEGHPDYMNGQCCGGKCIDLTTPDMACKICNDKTGAIESIRDTSACDWDGDGENDGICCNGNCVDQIGCGPPPCPKCQVRNEKGECVPENMGGFCTSGGKGGSCCQGTCMTSQCLSCFGAEDEPGVIRNARNGQSCDEGICCDGSCIDAISCGGEDILCTADSTMDDQCKIDGLNGLCCGQTCMVYGDVCHQCLDGVLYNAQDELRCASGKVCCAGICTEGASC